MLEQVFNQWAKVKITDQQVRQLIEIALAPNKETLNNIRDDKQSENSTAYRNLVNSAFGYAMISDSQQLDTTKGTLFGAYNAVTGYFQNVRSYKNEEEKINSLMCGGLGQKKAQITFDLCTDFAKNGEQALLLN
jgi:hypothetical protein